MLGALGTTLFFALTPVFAHQAAQRLGSVAANFWRLLVAAVLLGLWAHGFGRGLNSVAEPWFFFGGIVGFGIGGLGMFLSLPRLGSTLSTLIVQCGAAVAAAVTEYAWLGTVLTSWQALSATAVLTGVIIGLLPRSRPAGAGSAGGSPAFEAGGQTLKPAGRRRSWAPVDRHSREFQAGLGWALISATAQGVGAVLSRKAFAVAKAAGTLVDPGTAAYERVLGGLVVGGLVFAVLLLVRRTEHRRGARALGWVVANALTGPILGVTCYQWALRTTPAALVLPIVAMAPLLTIPFAAWLDRAPPPRATYYFGAVLAVAGTVGLALLPPGT